MENGDLHDLEANVARVLVHAAVSNGVHEVRRGALLEIFSQLVGVDARRTLDRELEHPADRHAVDMAVQSLGRVLVSEGLRLLMSSLTVIASDTLQARVFVVRCARRFGMSIGART